MYFSQVLSFLLKRLSVLLAVPLLLMSSLTYATFIVEEGVSITIEAGEGAYFDEKLEVQDGGELYLLGHMDLVAAISFYDTTDTSPLTAEEQADALKHRRENVFYCIGLCAFDDSDSTSTQFDESNTSNVSAAGNQTLNYKKGVLGDEGSAQEVSEAIFQTNLNRTGDLLENVFDYYLAAAPLENLTVDLSISGTDPDVEYFLDREQLTFTAGNWSRAQTVGISFIATSEDDEDITISVTAIADDVADSDNIYGYDGTEQATLSVVSLAADTEHQEIQLYEESTDTEDNAQAALSLAIEGRFLGLPSIAVSLTSFEGKHFTAAANIAQRLVRNIDKTQMSTDTILNVNVPDIPLEQIQGIQCTRLGKRHPSEQSFADENNAQLFYIGDNGGEADNGIGTDFDAINNNYVSVTPLQIDLTKYNEMDTVAQWIAQLWPPEQSVKG